MALSSRGTVARVKVALVMAGEQIEGAADAREHAEAEHVDLEEADGVEVVLVPLDAGAVGHGGVADGTICESGLRVSTKPPTCWERWRGKPVSSCVSSSTRARRGIGGIEAGFAHVLFGQGAARMRAPDHAGQRRDRILRKPHHLADLAHGRA